MQIWSSVALSQPQLVLDREQLVDYLGGIDAEDLAEIQQFDELDPALSGLNASHDGLGYAQLAR
jgi:hypothetical protein